MLHQSSGLPSLIVVSYWTRHVVGLNSRITEATSNIMVYGFRESKFFLVTGATGFIGAHVLDEILRRGHKVRAAVRSKSKAEQIAQARPQYSNLLEFTFIDDLTSPGVFDDAVKGVDGILHIASVRDKLCWVQPFSLT